MSDPGPVRYPASPGAPAVAAQLPERRACARLSDDSDSRSTSGGSSNAATWTRRATASPAWSRRISGARAHRVSVPARPAEADEAVQDAFVKVFAHISSYREAWPFEVWFTRILINGCLDRRKARARRERWFVPAEEASAADEARHAFGGTRELDPEARLLARERRAGSRRHRSAGRPSTDRVHAVSLRRLHAA